METMKSKTRSHKGKKNGDKSADSSRLDALKKELERLEKEEKALERRLTDLEKKELALAETVSELTQVKKRRPDFLINYMSSKDRELIQEVKTCSDIEVKKAKKGKTGEDIRRTQLYQPPKKEEKKIEVYRKQLLEAQIKNVLKQQEIRKKEEYERQEMLESRAPIKKLQMDRQFSDASRLFKALLTKGVMTIDDASRLLMVDKDTIKKWANDLEISGIIEINKPLYGSPKLKLKGLSEKMKETLVK